MTPASNMAHTQSRGRVNSKIRGKMDLFPWLIGAAAVTALSAGFWSIFSPTTDIWSGLVFVCGLTILVFIGVYVISIGRGDNSASLLAARTGFGRASELGLLINVLDDAPEAYLVQTRSGAIIYANHAYNELTRAGNRGRNLGRALPLEQVFSGDQALAAPLYRLSRAVRLGETVREDVSLAMLDGEQRSYSIQVSPVSGHKSYMVWRIADGQPGAGAPPPDIHFDRNADQSGSGRDRRAGAVPLAIDHQREQPVAVRADRSAADAGQRAEPVDVGGLAVDRAGLLENAPIAITILSPDGRIKFGNEAFRALIDGAPYLNEPFVEFVRESERADVNRALETVLEGKAMAVPVETPFCGRNERLAQLYASPIDLHASDEGRGVIAYLVDVTEQRLLEVQFTQSQKLQAVGQLAGGVAHDFNNLLTAIIGFCDLLLTRHGVGDPSFSDLDQIRQNANRAANLVRQLLAFSRKQTLTPKLLQPDDLLSELSILLQRLLGEKIELEVVHGRDLGLIKVDQAQFDTAMINLAVNARDAMPRGGKLTLKSSVFEQPASRDAASDLIVPGQYVLIEVSDTGTGIAPENINKIFEPFFTTKEVGAGTGLGLSTVYGIIKQMDGYIFLESALGAGTTFKIYLPRKEPSAAETPGADESGRQKTKDLTGMGTILLVEDEDAVRSFANRALSSRGYTVIEASNGAIAYELVQEYGEEIDLIISDVVMPEMDGPTLAAKVMEEYPGIKMIFISGYAEDAFKKSVERPEDLTFLAKPFSLKQLAATVKEAFNRR